MPMPSRTDRLAAMSSRAEGFSRVSSAGNPTVRMSYPVSESKRDKKSDPISMGFGRVSSAPGPPIVNEVHVSKEEKAASGLENLGIRVEREGERAKLSIKQVLEQKRINDATGALVKELFANVSPENLSGKISQIFREFDTDGSGGLDRDEIGRAFLLVGKPLKDSDIVAWLNEFDADGNGIIDDDEFAHMVRNRMGIPCSITCIPCLRGCSTIQRRRPMVGGKAKILPLVKKKPVKDDNTVKDDMYCGDQLLPGIASRKREMMKNFLTRDPEGEGGGKEVGDMFKRTTSAPAPASMLSEKEEIDNIFKAVRRNSLNRKVDMQWQGRAIENTFSAANSLMDQLNYFLVAHLKSVPREKLPKKIQETFATIDLDNSGELNKAEVGVAFERLGKPLSGDDLDAYMAMVDVDGNGVVDVCEFEHMTRRLLNIDCGFVCSTCRFLHKADKPDNWGENKEAALAEIQREKEEEERSTIEVFSRVSSSPATLAERDKLEQEVMTRRAKTLQKKKKQKENQVKNALSSPSMKTSGSGVSLSKSGSGTSLSSIQSQSPGLSPAVHLHTAAVKAASSATKATTPSPSRFGSKLHDAIAKASPEQRVN